MSICKECKQPDKSKCYECLDYFNLYQKYLHYKTDEIVSEDLLNQMIKNLNEFNDLRENNKKLLKQIKNNEKICKCILEKSKIIIDKLKGMNC